ncbi:hypothetical protein [Pedobacter arcticus]|nr:hypothetical protein [Pedobacter arcticus]
MKKILVALLIVSAIGVTSCKKDAETAPVKTLKVNGSSTNLNRNDTSTWD